MDVSADSKEIYEPPELTVEGTIRDLTQQHDWAGPLDGGNFHHPHHS